MVLNKGQEPDDYNPEVNTHSPGYLLCIQICKLLHNAISTEFLLTVQFTTFEYNKTCDRTPTEMSLNNATGQNYRETLRTS